MKSSKSTTEQLVNKRNKYFKKKNLINEQKDQETFVLSSGLRVVYKQIKSNSISHCGITIYVGSKNDGKHLGLAHFVEHMLFKGTKKRNTAQLLNRIENVGGEINAFTGRQTTCIYSSTMNEFVPRSIEVLFDIFSHSYFPSQEIEKERQVILDEISMYQDSPEDVIFDEFYSAHFNAHPYGTPILGTKKSVKKITKKVLQRFYKKYFTPENAVFSFVGAMPKEKLRHLLELHIGKEVGATKVDFKEVKLWDMEAYTPFKKQIKQDFNQGYQLMGFPAYPYEHEDRLTLALIANILGGPSLNSILNLKIREEKGLTYQIESSYSAYKCGGIFTIFFSTEKKNIEETRRLVLKELSKLRKHRISKSALKKAKQQFIGQSILAEESNSNLMILLGKEQVVYNNITSVKRFIENLENIQLSDIQRVSKEIFVKTKMSEIYI